MATPEGFTRGYVRCEEDINSITHGVFKKGKVYEIDYYDSYVISVVDEGNGEILIDQRSDYFKNNFIFL